MYVERNPVEFVRVRLAPSIKGVGSLLETIRVQLFLLHTLPLFHSFIKAVLLGRRNHFDGPGQCVLKGVCNVRL